ncbi:preprotein translocase subunit SecA [Streptacidiphilus sp. EB129]
MESHRSGSTAEELLPEAAAVVRETARRVLGHRLDDVQIMAGVAVHHGALAEMKTGEGKTMAVVLPAFLGALSGRGVHVMTANDYLAVRDAEAMAPVFRRLGLSCELLPPDDNRKSATIPPLRAAYAADVTYGTAFAFAYDYLRDNLAFGPDEVMQRGRHLAIVDEADLILIDDARRTAEISTAEPRGAFDYPSLTGIVTRLRDEVHYRVDQQRRLVTLTEAGIARLEDQLGVDDLYASGGPALLRMLDAVLLAKAVFQRDRDYVVENGAIALVDTGTGRLLQRARAAGGVTPALAAKENLKVPPERRTLATVPLHHYLRGYERLGALTGVATEADAYRRVYGLETVHVPTGRPVRRVDHPVHIHRTGAERLARAVQRTAECRAAGQPVLLGTASIGQAEEVSAALSLRGIPHRMLTAKNHADEAAIIAMAGSIGQVTVVTRMVARGVDIPLGGVGASAAERESVLRSGGLHVLALDLYETARLERHMRGRAGRRGDPGESEVYAALDDPSLVRFITPRALRMTRAVMGGSPEAMDSQSLSHVLERALEKDTGRLVENLCAAVRHEDVLAEQIDRIYRRRTEVRDDVGGAGMAERVRCALDAAVTRLAEQATSGPMDARRLHEELARIYPVGLSPESLAASEGPGLLALLLADAHAAYQRREAELSPAVMRELERRVCLSVLDRSWVDHLRGLDDLSADTSLHTLAGGDALAYYHSEASRLFADLLQRIDSEMVGYVFSLDVTVEVEDVAG